MNTTAAASAPVPSTFPFPHPTRTPPAPPRPSYPLSALCCQCRLPTMATGVAAVQVEGPCSPSSSSSSSSSSSYLSGGNGCSVDNDGSSIAGFHGRRVLVLLSTLPLLLSRRCNAELFDANSQGLDADESLVVRTEVRKVLSKAKAAGVLRLAFHDAGTFDANNNTGGMNGSIVLELNRPENAGLSKSVKILEKAKSELDKVHQVSWADLIAVAGAEAVSLCGGPNIPVQLGRKDARMPDPEGKLPEEKLNASELKKCFLEKGFSTQELVILSGAHTLGGKGFGNPNVFDSTYYKVLLEKPWMSSDGMKRMIGLPSDHALVEDEECLRWITTYAADQAKFFDDFRRAYVKLVNTGASWRKS